MTDGFRAPDLDLPPARFLPSSTIGSWLGVLRNLPSLSGAMKMWVFDAKQQLAWRETNPPRVITTRVKKRDGSFATFSIDDSLADVYLKPTPEFEAWDHWFHTGALPDDDA